MRVTLPSSEQVTEQVTEQVQKLLLALEVGTQNRIELMHALNLKHRPTFLYNYLQPAINADYIALTIPDKPTSSKQQYYLTAKGKQFIHSL